MELLSVRTARVLAFFPTGEINPRGRSLIHEVVPAFVERYKFVKYPQKFEEFDESKGVRFEGGVWNNLETTVVLYNNGIQVDARSSTDDSELILEDALKWAADTFGLIYKPAMLTRKAYLSELDVACETPLDALNPKLNAFVDKLSKTVTLLISKQLLSGLTSTRLLIKALLGQCESNDSWTYPFQRINTMPVRRCPPRPIWNFWKSLNQYSRHNNQCQASPNVRTHLSPSALRH